MNLGEIGWGLFNWIDLVQDLVESSSEHDNGKFQVP
jgi:hypothetical protein